jgi:hypothetical protein
MSNSIATPIPVFISYRHADHRVLDEVRDHLGFLENSKSIQVFDDRNINAGDDWDERIKSELEQAKIIILIITAKFMRSHYCTNIELRGALELRAKQGTRVIPIIAEDCDWEAMPIFSIAALPKDEANNLKPLKRWRGNRDSALKQISQHVRRSIENLAKGMPVAKKYIESQQITSISRKTARLGVTLGWQLARLEFFDGSSFEEARAAAPKVREEIDFLLQQDGTDKLFKDYNKEHNVQTLINRILIYYDANDSEMHAAILIGICALRVSLAGASSNKDHNDEMLRIAQSCIQQVDDSIIPDKDEFFNSIIAAKKNNTEFNINDVVKLLGK